MWLRFHGECVFILLALGRNRYKLERIEVVGFVGIFTFQVLESNSRQEIFEPWVRRIVELVGLSDAEPSLWAFYDFLQRDPGFIVIKDVFDFNEKARADGGRARPVKSWFRSWRGRYCGHRRRA